MTVEDGKTTDDFFPSRFMKASDVNKENPILTIMDVNCEVIGEDSQNKLVLAFRETTKELVMNKTNAVNIGEIYGNNPNGWIGKRVELFTTFVDFRGKSIEAVRITPKVPTGEPAPPPAPEPIP